MARKKEVTSRSDSIAGQPELGKTVKAPAKKPAKAAGGVRGAQIEARLNKLGLVSANDLALHLPLRYEDYTTCVPLAQLGEERSFCTEGVVTHSEVRYRPRRQWVYAIEDGPSVLTLRFFTFYPNQQKALAIGTRVRVFGEVRHGHFGLEMVHPKFTVLKATPGDVPDAPLPDRLTPVYPTTAGLSQEALSARIGHALRNESVLHDCLPAAVVDGEALWGWSRALRFLHAPPPELSTGEQSALSSRTHPAWQRIKFDELLAQQLSLKRHRSARARRRAMALPGDGRLTSALLQRLPFALTSAQQRVWREIGDDLGRTVPMHRLLQGDVGSGKTVIAALAALRAIECGRQAALMAPTEILAEQHYHKLSAWLSGLSIQLVWLSGTSAAAQRRAVAEQLAAGGPVLAVGTHALFQEGISMPNLALAIVDEQHRFGVAQRLALRDKGKDRSGRAAVEVHQLMMSATPIPRTLAMSFYADLDVSVIDELPPGRTPVATRLVNQSRRDEIVAYVGKCCADGAQAYWVCPLIEESEKLSLQAAQTLHEELVAVFDGEATRLGVLLPKLRVGLLHGRMKPAEKTATMEAFVRGDIQLLVATTVIEVGVDVPNASMMVIEHAERFGLAQLHQLRGRVGRGSRESQCILLYEAPLGATAKARLKVIYESNDGFEIARQDLHIRGPGELLGARQSGVPLLRFADLETDMALLERAREAADHLLADAALCDAVVTPLIDRWLGGRVDFFKA